MADRVLSVEFAPLYLEDDVILADGSYKQTPATDYRALRVASGANVFFVSEHKLDLSGYAMEDLTMYFRNSFEQRGGLTELQWQIDDETQPGLESYDVNFFETTVLSSVPMSDDNLVAMSISQPGFISAGIPGIEFGNFDRTHIIHGSQLLWAIESNIGADALTKSGGAYCRIAQANDFSSLEPTAADCIYCYRVIYLPPSYTRTEEKGIDYVGVPPKRVLLNAMSDQEPQLEYMMRLKRSYELANQV